MQGAVADNPALAIEEAASLARQLGAGDALTAQLDALSDAVPPGPPAAGGALIGFDRPAVVYVASRFDPDGPVPAVLRGLIARRPWERHLVLFTADDPALARAAEFLGQVGAFAFGPDPSLGLFDRWLWLAAKLDAMAAQRVVVVADGDDVAAQLATRRMAPRYGRRLYVLQANGAVPDAGGPLGGATHLSLSATGRAALRAAGLRAARVVVPSEPEVSTAVISSIPTAPVPGFGRLAAVKRALTPSRWGVRRLRASAEPAFAQSHGLASQSTGTAAGLGRAARRWARIVAAGEGRLDRPPPPADPALRAAAATMFDEAHYLGALPEAAQATAAADPLAHYLGRGEVAGFAPHVLFDPALAALDLARHGTPAPPGAVLASWVSGNAATRPHLLIDPAYMRAQLGVAGAAANAADLLANLAGDGTADPPAPHPLIEPSALSPGAPEAFASDFRAWLGGRLPASRQPCPLFDPATYCRGGRAERLLHAAPTLLWAHLVEGSLAHVQPHPLIDPASIDRRRPGMLTDAGTALEAVVRGRIGAADPHPLVDTAHLLTQEPGLSRSAVPPLRYFLERAAADMIDPHPWFSTHFYLYHSPDVLRAGVNPLLHYLAYGAVEGRWPAGFFDGNQHYHRYQGDDRDNPLMAYARRGAGLFWMALGQDDAVRRLALDLARTQFAAEAGGTDGGAAARMLRDALHPPTGTPHPTLLTETRALLTDTTAAAPARLQVLAPAEEVTVMRPPVVAARHMTPPSGRYTAPVIDVGEFEGAVVVGGNDGFALASGEWLDHSLAAFDPAAMEVKGNAAVFAVAHGRVLLRRHTEAGSVPAGIFCCGTYSKNYFHFLIETLPRALAANRVAPPGVPVLTDDDMPAQHYQALRLMLPDRPILRLRRQVAIRVNRLWAAAQVNAVQDAYLKPDVPVDAARIHPATLAPFAALAARLGPPAAGSKVGYHAPRRLWLRRESPWRQLLNSAEIENELIARGFEAVNCGALPFADQVRLIAGAEAIVAQSGAHLANIVFARPGTRVFALFSDAPGGNFNLWPALGTPLGVEVINVAGWRVPGTAAGGQPAAHEHFSMNLAQVTAFFPAAIAQDEAPALLSALQRAGAAADVLTSAWAIRAESTPTKFEDRLRRLRSQAVAAVRAAPDTALSELVAHGLFSDPWTTLKSGLRALQSFDASEAAAITELEAAFAQLARAGAAAPAPDDARRLLLQARLLLPAWRLPLVAAPEVLPPDALTSYLRYLAQPPYLFRPGEDAAYVDYAVALLDWIDAQLAPGRPEAVRHAVARMAGELDLSQLLLIDAPLQAFFTARNRVLDRIAVAEGTARPAPRPADGSEGRRRLGVLFRTFDKGPDSEAVVALLRGFDRTRWEIYGYSIGFEDRVVSADTDFDRAMDAVIEHRRLVSGDPAQLRRELLADGLDLLLFANATTYGLKTMELALYHPVAPVQVVTNSHLPMPLGFPSFQAYLTGLSDDPNHDVPQADYPERLLRVKGPVIAYLTSLQPKARPPLDRSHLGVEADAVVMMNAGSLQKLRHGCLTAMMTAVRNTPRGVLLLAPHNPGWAGRSQAFAFNRQLEETAAEVGLPMDRLRVLSEMTVLETEAALSCADVYLNPFPHGGATMTHLALIYGVPPVTLRRRSTRSIDQFLIESLGFPELLADTEADYVALAAALACDGVRRSALSEALRMAAKAPPFVDNLAWSRDIEAALESLLDPASDWARERHTPLSRHAKNRTR